MTPLNIVSFRSSLIITSPHKLIIVHIDGVFLPFEGQRNYIFDVKETPELLKSFYF